MPGSSMGWLKAKQTVQRMAEQRSIGYEVPYHPGPCMLCVRLFNSHLPKDPPTNCKGGGTGARSELMPTCVLVA
eukprot:1843608-Amphidinium_carterae.1